MYFVESVQAVREPFLKEQGFSTELDSGADDLANPKKLMKGRIDVWIAGLLQAPYKTKQAGLNPADIECVYRVKDTELYIAFHKDTPDDVVQAWQKALDDMKSDGGYQKILDKYFGE